MNASLEHWARLALTPGLGPAGCGRLLRSCGSPAAALGADRAHLRALGLDEAAVRWLRDGPGSAALERVLAWPQSPGQGVMTPDSAAYPARLGEIADPPLLLFHRGDSELLGLPALAMVGSRNPTPSGRDTARDFARHLAASGLVVASGLATGIDAAAHQGALDADGLTLAVMGTGPDRVYPARNHSLASRILDGGGLLVTELPPGTEARRHHFPRRNRILSALCLGTLVVEAGPRSGSLITARCAVDQGREVFAIPGSIHNPMARGCHALIRQGAKLVETAADVLEELGPLLGAALRPAAPQAAPAHAGQPGESALDPDHGRLLAALDDTPTAIDRLVERTGFQAAEIASMLLILELQGRVQALPGGLFRRPG